jgi:fatty acid omega-hydroxylase
VYLIKFDLNSIGGSDSEYGKALTNCFEAVGKRFGENMLFPITEMFDFQLKRDFKYVKSFALKYVEERLKSRVRHEDIMQMLIDDEIDSEVKSTNEQLVDHVVSLLLAGRDTTAGTVSWLIYALQFYPQCADRISKEAIEVMGERLIPTYDDVKKCKYAMASFKEAVRLYPAITKSIRETLADDVLPNGVKIKRGTYIMYSIPAVNRSEKIWPDADKFIPERYLNAKEPSKFEYLSFSAGPRVCIGKGISETQGVFVLLCFIRNFEIVSADLNSVERTFGLTMGMKNGFKCRLKARDA